MPALVVDASVAAKWLLRDEPQTGDADALIDAFGDGIVSLVAPRQIAIEVVAAVRKAVLNGRIQQADASTRLDLWLQQVSDRFLLFENERLCIAAFNRSLTRATTVFDALYIELAAALEVSVVVADARLLRSPAALPFVMPLSRVASWLREQAGA